MTQKVEGDRCIAVPRQRDGERLHQLLRAGKSMGNDDDRRGAAAGLCERS